MKGNIFFEKELKTYDFVGKFTSIENMDKLESEITGLKDTGKLNDWIYENYLQFDFDVLKGYKSIMISAMKLPVVKVTVEKNNSIKEVMIPSAYYSGGKVEGYNKNIDTMFNEHGVKYKPVHLPCKLLVARTGLGSYGKNNIAYIEEFGSYFRMRAFLTDIEMDKDNWYEVTQTDNCTSCNVCVTNCPNNVINDETYLIDAGQCITYPNEIEGDFPKWVMPEWHNALIGCMKCQLDCPNNLEFKNDMKIISHLTEENIQDIFKTNNYEDLKDDTKLKLTEMETSPYYDVFKRNFEAVYHNL
jgi:epoxyqueuosine reductase